MFKIPIKSTSLEIQSPLIMGILNSTPDSFFKASRTTTVDAALEKAAQFIQEGANIIDIGGQSTRPGAIKINAETEIKRIVPLFKSLCKHFPKTLFSVDTFNATVAKAAIDAGAQIVNDISCGLFDDALLDVVAQEKVGYIGMHITGSIENMHQVEKRVQIMPSLIHFFIERQKILAAKGIMEWVIDPGFGFSKSVDENFTIVAQLDQLKILGLPILLGVSRKSSIYKTLEISAEDALNGTTVLHTIGLLKGANIIRVHDVKEAREVVLLMNRLQLTT